MGEINAALCRIPLTAAVHALDEFIFDRTAQLPVAPSKSAAGFSDSYWFNNIRQLLPFRRAMRR